MTSSAVIMSTLLTIPLIIILCCHGNASGAGTTPNLREIFIGRCWDYQTVVNPGAFNRTRDCTELWTLFHAAFAFKAPCNVSVSAYDEFTLKAHHDVPRDLNMFWSGVYTTVHEYNEVIPRYTVVADTMTGYLLDNLAFCGSLTDPSGMDPDSCPDWGSCDNQADVSFWESVSKTFAETSEGEIRVMLSGNRQAFRSDSVFAEVELPNINPDKVDLIYALVVLDYDKPVVEVCGNGSLIELERLVKTAGIEYKCTNNPVDIKHLLCMENVDAPECKAFLNVQTCSAAVVRPLAYTVILMVTWHLLNST